MDQLILIAPIGVAVVLAFFYLRRFASPAASHWAWAWLFLYGSGLISAWESDSLWFAALGSGFATLFGPFLLAGALALVERATPGWLWPLAALSVASRTLAALFLGTEVRFALVLAVGWPWLLGSTWVLGRDVFRRSARGSERILATAVAGFALLWPVDAAMRVANLSMLRVLGAWIALSVLVAAAQIFVALERSIRAREGLRAERERLARLVEETSDLIGIVDSDGRLRYLNAAGRRLLALTDIEGMSVYELHPREEAERLETEIFPAARRHGLWQGETVLRTRTGSLVPVSAMLFPQLDSSGQVTGYATSMRDLAERITRERVLESERRLFRTIVDAVPIGIFHLDENWRYRLINRAAADLFRLPDPEAWIGRPAIECLREVVVPRISRNDELGTSFAAWLRDVVSGASGGDAAGHCEAAIRRGHDDRPLEIHRIELTLEEPTQILEVASAPVQGPDGTFRGRVWITRDMTERHQLEERLQSRNRTEAVGQFAGGIAHDFGNLLMVIGGFANLLRNRVDEDDEAVDCITSIASTVDSGQALIRQLLAFSRGTRGIPVVVDLNRFLLAAKALLDRLIGEDVCLELQLDPRAGCVRADPSQLEQLLLNLATNARDAMPRGGALRIETKRLSPEEAPEIQSRAGWTQLAVVDTGCGMSAETQLRAFEPFFTTKPHGEGTGLGLSTASAIVHQLDGEIRICSEVEKGTCVEIDLPRVEKPMTAGDLA